MPSKPLTVVSARALGSPCVKHTGDGALRWAPPDASGIYGAVVAFATLSLAIPGLVIRARQLRESARVPVSLFSLASRVRAGDLQST